jgi:hypothetical protein
MYNILCKLGQNFDYDKKDTFIRISFAGCNGICATIWGNVDSYRAESKGNEGFGNENFCQRHFQYPEAEHKGCGSTV